MKPQKQLKVRMLMLTKGVTVLKLSRETGIHPSMISLILNGWREPSAEHVAKIEQYLGEDDLFNRRRV